MKFRIISQGVFGVEFETNLFCPLINEHNEFSSAIYLAIIRKLKIEKKTYVRDHINNAYL